MGSEPAVELLRAEATSLAQEFPGLGDDDQPGRGGHAGATASTATLGVADEDLLDELADFRTPVLLGDFAMMDGYAPDLGPADCGIMSYYGAADDIAPISWSARTTGAARVVELAGDHYFSAAGSRTAIGWPRSPAHQ